MVKRTKVIIVLLTICFVVGSFFVSAKAISELNVNNTEISATDLQAIQNPLLKFEVSAPDNTKASDLHYYVENVNTHQFVQSGISNDGTIQLELIPSNDEINSITTKNEYYYLDYALHVFDSKNTNMACYYFSVPVINDTKAVTKELFTDISYNCSSTRVTPIKLAPIEKGNIIFPTSNLEKTCVEISSTFWIEVIDSSEGISSTVVGRLSGMNGMSSEFVYITTSSVNIDAKVNYGAGWSTSGGVSKTISAQSHHLFQSTWTSGETRPVREFFRYRWEKLVYHFSEADVIVERIVPMYHIGADGWSGTTYPYTYNNGKSGSTVRSGSWGNYHVVRPGNYTDSTIANGVYISHAASFRGASIGLTTSYNTTVKHMHRSIDGRYYLKYDLDNNRTDWYVTLDSQQP